MLSTRQNQNYKQRLKPQLSFSRKTVIIFVALFATIGGYVLWRSFAASNLNSGDINNDGVVDIQDLSILLSNYGTSNSNADVNGDGNVNIVDLSILLSNFHKTFPQNNTEVDLSKACVSGNCDDAFANLQPGVNYYLPTGTWRFTEPFNIPSNVSLEGDGTGIDQTNLVYSGPKISGAIVIAGESGKDWVNGHISGMEIETDQLYKLRNTTSTFNTIDQAGIGLEIINPTDSSSVNNIDVWRHATNSVVIENHASAPGPGVFQFSDFFIGGSPTPFLANGSSARILVRFGGIDVGFVSQAGMVFDGAQSGATSVVESVKIEGDEDIPGYIVKGEAPVVFVGTTRYLGEATYFPTPLHSAPAYTERHSSGTATNTLQCISCTDLGERLADALPERSLSIPTSNWGIDLSNLSIGGNNAVVSALATPEIPLPRPHNFTNLASQCVNGNCDAAFANVKSWGSRVYLPAGLWTFTQPFTIPSDSTLFGDGPQPGDQGGTELRYEGTSIPGNSAINFGNSGDLSAGRLFSIRVSTTRSLSSGFGLRVINPTNATTVEDISITGFPDGQILVDNGPAGTSPGTGNGPSANFFRIANFSLSGGVHPLYAIGGRQTFLIEHGSITLGATSRDGMFLKGAEGSAATIVTNGVNITGNYDVPGFHVQGIAVYLFVNSSRTATSQTKLTSPGFLHTNAPGDTSTTRYVQCMHCMVSGLQTAFSLQYLGITVPAVDGQQFDYLNPTTAYVTTKTPFNTGLPSVMGSASVGQTLSAVNGSWSSNPTSFTYQWYTCQSSGSHCTPISGETASTFLIPTVDAGIPLRVVVIANNQYGSWSATSLPILVSTSP